MTFEKFLESTAATSPPGELGDALVALWHAKKGSWEKSHAIVQKLSTREAAWVHAWLHRQEGESSNAHYWYQRAEREAFQGNLEAEWEAISRELLQ